ncbi:putative heterokaryon incompatibility protein [Neofusicoccum parvum]|uniref:Heterokaryon incompatibility protein n=1 Tax=Neofusicoccum parvum TaxID=310453 RepID=A0ACB5SL13_9PEZI|nr:putative heterokaryon incompatibility protein [Neofusicoccum parvum]
MKRLRKWLDVCNESHHGRCHNLPTWQTVDPLKELLLIDTEHGCLVQRPGATKYFALSYLWGYIPDILETKISNVEDLKKKGAFTAKDSVFQIPQTIRDSISLVRALGERYLWVDRFCIIQDHPGKHAVISRMDAVYANAYCTIVATDGGNADHGLRGVGLARAILQQTVDLPQCPLVTETDVGYESKYHTRGWTYQELSLSARQLVFADETVFWACQAAFWKEQMRGEPDSGKADEFFELPFLTWPDLGSWELFCYNYNWRELSFQEDAHVAFSGVERVIERSFPAGFLYGLPELFFDLTLLWWANEPLKRRVKPSADNGYSLPSWSWLGWHGRVNGTAGDPVQSYVRATATSLRMVQDLRVDPLVDWVHVGPRNGQERRIRNHYHLWRARGEKQPAAPAGWTCEATERSTHYTSQSAPGVLFRYPLPSAAEMPPEDEQRTWPPHLRLRSSRAFFTMTPCTFKSVPQTMVLVADKNGRWGGVLFLNVDSRDAPFGDPCELVAVSRGSARQDRKGPASTMLADLYWEDIIKTDAVYEFYNVLWVKWKGDHVVREGVGRIEKSVWEKQNLEPIDTQLR